MKLLRADCHSLGRSDRHPHLSVNGDGPATRAFHSLSTVDREELGLGRLLYLIEADNYAFPSMANRI
jgi:hypothetical protein